MKHGSWCSLGSAIFWALSSSRALSLGLQNLPPLGHHFPGCNACMIILVHWSSGKHDSQGRAWDKNVYAYIYAYIHSYVYMLVCVFGSQKCTRGTQNLSGFVLQGTNFRSYLTFIFSILSVERVKEPGRAILFTQPCCSPQSILNRNSFDPCRLSIRRCSWLGGEADRRACLPMILICLPPVLIRSLCKGSFGRKLAISHNGSRRDTSSLKSCQLTLAPVLLSHPLFNQVGGASVPDTRLCRWGMIYCPAIRELFNLVFMNT